MCGNIHAGEEPPESCPVCGASADKFEVIDEVQTAESETKASKRWRCKVCGYIHEGPEAPDACPVCSASSDKFEVVDVETKEAEKCSICGVPGINSSSIKYFTTIK